MVHLVVGHLTKCLENGYINDCIECAAGMRILQPGLHGYHFRDEGAGSR